MEYVEAVLTSIGLLKDAWSSISRCFNYRKILDNNCKTLDEKMERLKCREQDVYTELHDAQHQRKKEKKEVEHWIKKVQDMKSEVERMEGEVRKGKWLSRLELLRQSEENIEKVDKLLEEGRFPDGILIEVVRDEGKALLVPQLTGETTAKINMEKIWKCLKEGGTQSIGVWGLGGIGKTTIVMHIHNLLLKEEDAFGTVVWVAVSKDSSIPELQDAIANHINLDLSKEEDESKRSALLFDALQKVKKFVLIFDDVWEVYPPSKVGIPIEVAADGGGGKVIVTTRSKEVCQKMGCKEIINVELLHEEEAWELFKGTLDRRNPLSQQEEKIAKAIVKECAGLPLAIVTTARSMSIVYDIAEWRNALNELRERVKGHTINMENDVFKILEFSYSRLNDEKLQECLLYCALFPEDYKIRRIDLIHYWIAEGLIEEMRSRQDERDRGHAILNKLENVSLLERCQNGKCVKMHDVIRDMAINITRRSRRFMVKTGINIKEDLLPIEQTEWSNNKNLQRVSLIDCRLSSSMAVPNFNCPKLSTLLLQKLSRLRSSSKDEGLPNSFFMHMAGLKVLDLSCTNIVLLPASIYEMVNLRALILFRCGRLKQIGSLEKLTELRKLDLRRNELERLPDGIDKLVHLKEFYWTSYVMERPNTPIIFHLLPNLVRLQSLVLRDKRFSDVGMKELRGLRKLEILSIRFSDLRNFNAYFRKLPCPRLTHYLVLLNGVRRHYSSSLGLSKEVVVRDCRLIGGKENDDHQLVLPANLQVLELTGCELLPNGIGLLDVSPSLKTAMDLKACEIAQCKGIEYVWWADGCIVSSVNILYLRDLPNLRVLFKLRPTENIVSCSSLKHLSVTDCHELKHLFTAELVKSHHLQNLQSIVVCGCDQMEDIIILAEVEEEKGINNDLILCFPNLRSLCLKQVPKLKSIWKGKMTCASIQRVAVEKCPNLRRLPLSLDATTDFDGEVRASTPPLKEIWGEEQWWDEVEWELKSLFQPLFAPIESQFSDSRLFMFEKYYKKAWEEIYEKV